MPAGGQGGGQACGATEGARARGAGACCPAVHPLTRLYVTTLCLPQVLDLAKAFRITDQQPGLYWLPLTAHQVAAKAAARQEREEKKERGI